MKQQFINKYKIFLLVTLLVSSPVAMALNFAVDNTGGFCVDHSASGGNFATLAAAMAAANAAGAPHTIDICPSGTAYVAQAGALAAANYAGLTIQGTTGIAANVTVNPTGNNETFDVRQPNVTIQHLSVNNLGNTNDGIEIRGNNVSILNVDIQNTGRNGVLVFTSTNVTISNVTIATTVREGIYANAGSTSLTINSADGTKPATAISATNRECIEVDAANVDINDITLSNCGRQGLRLDGANAALDSAVINTTGNEGIMLNGLAPLLNQDNPANTISISNTGQEGIQSTNNADNLIIDNLTIDTTNRECAAHQGDGDGVTITFENYNLSNCGREGLFMRSPNQLADNITVNTTGNSRECMEVDGNTSTVSNLDLDNCSGVGLRFDGANVTVTTADINTTGTYGLLVSGNDGIVSDVDINNANNTGIRIESQRADLDDITVINTRVHGVQITQHDADITNLTLTNIGTYNGGNGGADGITVTNRRLNLTNVTINDARDFGIHFNTANTNFGGAVNFTNITITNTGDDGIYVRQSTNNLVMDTINISNSADRGITLRQTRRAVLSNMIIDSNTGDGIVIERSRQNDISGSTISNNNRGIILLTNNNNTTDEARNNDIYFNYILNNASFGLRIFNNGTADNDNNNIYENCFSNPAGVNARDDETIGSPAANNFDDGTRGNYWDDDSAGTGFSNTCADGDSNGICDNFFPIPNAGNSRDDFPLVNCGLDKFAEYLMDESAWGVVNDNVGSNNGTQVGSATNAYPVPYPTIPVPPDSALSGDPGTCGTGAFLANFAQATRDAVDTTLDVDSTIGSTGSISFWYTSLTAWNDGNVRMLFDASNDLGGTGPDKPFFMAKLGSGALAFRVEGTTTAMATAFTPAFTYAALTWHHIAVTWDFPNDQIEIYVDGTLQATASGSGPGLSASIGNTDTLYIGDNRTTNIGGGYTGNSAGGGIDEFRVYKRVIPSVLVNRDRSERHTCITPPDHYSITHNNVGVTCEASTVTITAHDTGDIPINVPGGTTLTLNAYIDGTTTNTGTWDSATGGGSLAGNPGNPVTYTWPTGTEENSFTIELRQLTPETIDIDLLDSIGTTEKGDGDNSDAEDPEIEFRDAVFRVVDSLNTPVSITTKLSGKQSNTAGISFQDLYLQAIETTDSTECQGVFESENNVSVEMAFECDDPASCETVEVEVEDDSSSLIAIDDNPNGTVTVYQPVQFDFDADSKTPLRFVYNDAGQITLHARYDIDSPNMVYMSGMSNSFTVKPAGLCVESTDTDSDCVSADGSCTKFKKAGDLDAENFFNLIVRGVTWQTDVETDTDFCTGNITTPNFELSGVVLTSNLIAPSPGGTNAALGVGSVDIIDADKGTNTEANQSVDEVGVFTITATPAALSYFGETIAASTSASIGRFYPDRFNVTMLNSPAFADSCSGFTYQDQSFYYGTAPLLEITALNSDGNTTLNYGGDFWKLSGSTLPRNYVDGSGTPPAATFTSTTAGSVTLAGETDFNGIGTLALDAGTSADEFMYQKGTPEAAFGADVDVTFLAAGFQDTDHTGLKPVCYDITNDGTCDDFTHLMIQGTELRWGRMVLANGFGSELLPVEVPLSVEYFGADGFEINSLDTCTTYDSADMTFSNASGVSLGNLAITGSGTIVNGVDDPANSVLATSTASEIGSADITIDLTSQDWLRDDWDGIDQGADLLIYDDDPVSRLTWGIFSGPDEFIYIREPW
ncbi:MAG: hypothetical protein HND53_06835 [Proteobacteria bacterium]|nr:hypothetical protein [Pseudomonadota bacterium]NOG60200.1 hypothetical protein [Pseudomonadota bacterium]